MKGKTKSGEITHQSRQDADAMLALREALLEFLAGNNSHTWNQHVMAFVPRQTLMRTLYWNDLYQRILGVPGSIMEFGVQWGSTLCTMASLRGIHEPYNSSRRLIGFDTFAGFPAVSRPDGSVPKTGDYKVAVGWDKKLRDILAQHEALSPMSHLTRFELVKGDIGKTVPKYFKGHPSEVVAMAIFDADLYEPTKVALTQVLPRLTKGSLLVFDEFAHPSFPGETRAIDEVIGIRNLRIQRSPYQGHRAFAVWE